MNKQLLLLTALFSSMAIVMVSCDDDDTPEDLSPVVTIAEPTAGDSFKSGDTLHIEWNATAGAGHDLHESLVLLMNLADSTLAFSDTPYVHELTTFDYHEHVVLPTVSAANQFKLTVTVSDHDGLEAMKEVSFQVNP